MRAKIALILGLVASIVAEAPLHSSGYNYDKPATGAVELARQTSFTVQPAPQYRQPIAQQPQPQARLNIQPLPLAIQPLSNAYHYNPPPPLPQSAPVQAQPQINYVQPQPQYQQPAQTYQVQHQQVQNYQQSQQAYNYPRPQAQPVVQTYQQPQAQPQQLYQQPLQQIQKPAQQYYQPAQQYQQPQPKPQPAQIYQQPIQQYQQPIQNYQQPIQQYQRPVQQYQQPIQQYYQPAPQQVQPAPLYQQPQQQVTTKTANDGYHYDNPQQVFNQGQTSSLSGSLSSADAEVIEPQVQQRYVQPLGRLQNGGSQNFQTQSFTSSSGLDSSVANHVANVLQQDENNDLARSGLSSYSRVLGVSLGSPSKSIEVSSFVQNSPISSDLTSSSGSFATSGSGNSISNDYGLPEVIANRQAQSSASATANSSSQSQFNNFVPNVNQPISSYGVPQK